MKIVVAIAPNAPMDRILGEAVKQAKLQHGELVIVSIAELFQTMEHYLSLEAGIEAMLPPVQACVEEARVAASSEGVAAKIRAEAGPSPAEKILACAEEEDADLIVMGHKEKKGIDRFLLGSVAFKVLTHASCSVLVVKNG